MLKTTETAANSLPPPKESPSRAWRSSRDGCTTVDLNTNHPWSIYKLFNFRCIGFIFPRWTPSPQDLSPVSKLRTTLPPKHNCFNNPPPSQGKYPNPPSCWASEKIWSKSTKTDSPLISSKAGRPKPYLRPCPREAKGKLPVLHSFINYQWSS